MHTARSSSRLGGGLHQASPGPGTIMLAVTTNETKK